MPDRVGQSDVSDQTAERYQAVLEYLADRDNWLGDPLDQTATLHGHFTPYELAQRGLTGEED